MSRKQDRDTQLVGIRLDRGLVAELHKIAGRMTAEQGKTVLHTDIMRGCISRVDDLTRYDYKMTISSNYADICANGLEAEFLADAGVSLIDIMQIDDINELRSYCITSRYYAYEYDTSDDDDDDTSDDDKSEE
jgi:hypothetical protein